MIEQRLEDAATAAQGGDLQTCLTALTALSHEERRALFPRLKKLAVAADKLASDNYVSGTYAELSRRYRVLVAAALVTCVPSELSFFERHRPGDEAIDALIQIAPPWLPHAAEALVAVSPDFHRLARQLVRRGVSAEPTHDNYIVGFYTDTRFGTHPFDADPVTLQREVWRLFEVEGNGDSSLAARDKYTHDDKTWAAAFQRHLALGNLDRARVLDATLGALARDFAPFRAGWYSRFHDALAPTPNEVDARADRYLRLLSSAVPATATLALRIVKSLDGRHPLDTATLSSALAPLLLARHKGTAIAAIALLKNAAKRGAEDARLASAAVVDALAHEAPDVQKAVLDLLDERRASVDEATRARIAEAAATIAPSLRKRLDGWGAVPSADARAVAGAVETAAPAAAGMPAAWESLANDRAIAPLTNLVELVQELSAIIEDDSDPDRVERVLAGIAAWGPLDEAGLGLAAPLAKRAKAIKQDAREKPIRLSLVALVRAWTAKPGTALEAFASAGLDILTTDEHTPGLAPLFADRALGLARAIAAGAPASLWSTPTHRGGYLDPRVLVARVARLGSGPAPAVFVGDFALALLRLGDAHREEARVSLEACGLEGELADVLRHALGGDAVVGKTAALWAAAARARHPRADDPAVAAIHPKLGPDGAIAARFGWSVKARTSNGYTFHDISRTIEPKLPKVVPTDQVATRRALDTHGGEASYMRWTFSGWPAGEESFFGTHLVRLANNLGWWEARWHDHAVLAMLSAPGPSFGRNRLTLLAMGLSAKEPGQQGLSVDAAIAAIDEGRVEAATLGPILAELRASGLVTLKRWSVSLARVAAASPRHADVIARALQHTFRGDPTKPPRDELSLIALLVELLAGAGARVADAEAWVYLSKGKHRAKIAPFAPARGPV